MGQISKRNGRSGEDDDAAEAGIKQPSRRRPKRPRTEEERPPTEQTEDGNDSTPSPATTQTSEDGASASSAPAERDAGESSLQKQNNQPAAPDRDQQKIQKLKLKKQRQKERRKEKQAQAATAAATEKQRRADSQSALHQGQREEREKKQKLKTSSTSPRQFTPLAEGVLIQDLVLGEGPLARPRKEMRVSYTLRARSHTSGKIIDSNGNYGFRLGTGDVIRGYDIGLEGMRVGGTRRLIVPPGCGYGRKDIGAGRGNDLYFQIELLYVAP